MLDTLKLKIPLTEKQHRRVTQQVTDDDRAQWVLFHPKTGELGFLRCKGLSETDYHSYHRHILFDVPLFWIESKTFLTFEFSVPKYWYGHNVSLLYDWLGALEHFKRRLEQQFGLHSKNRCPRLAPVGDWLVSRADLCYAYQFPNQTTCHHYLEGLKPVHYPRKRPTIHPTSIVFVGATYSLKIYEKLPEFKAHDAKELRKAKASPDWISYLEKKAAGVLRVEATLRRQYLRVKGVHTVSDLATSTIDFAVSEDWPPDKDGVNALALLCHRYTQQHSLNLDTVENGFIMTEPSDGFCLMLLNENDDLVTYLESTDRSPVDAPVKGTVWHYSYTGKSVIINRRHFSESSLQFFLNKFLGGCPGMQEVDQVRSKLSEHYKPVKTARLTAFWLYVRRFGTNEAKNNFGHNSYYVSKRDLKKAGVSLFEPADNIIPIDKDFMAAFKMKVPSEYVVNKVDDFRDGDNLLNLPVNKIG